MMKVIILGLVGVSTPGILAAFDTVIPTDEALPTGDPPAFFDRRDHFLLPVGVSESLNVQPARLHTNKFYSNLVVRFPCVCICT